VKLAGASAPGPAEDVAENVPEIIESAARVILIAARPVGVFAVILVRRALLATLVNLAGVVTLALVRVAEDRERRGDALELASACLSPGCRSGWCSFASRRYARRISSSDALRLTPSSL